MTESNVIRIDGTPAPKDGKSALSDAERTHIQDAINALQEALDKDVLRAVHCITFLTGGDSSSGLFGAPINVSELLGHLALTNDKVLTEYRKAYGEPGK